MQVAIKELLLRAKLSLAFQTHLILKDISFEIYNTAGKPQIVSLVGPSGVGKTQLFRCIAGLQTPTTGGVYINGNSEPVREGQVGVVAQDYPLIETRTVIGNLVRAFRIAKRGDEKQAQTMALDYLNRFGLTGLTGHYPCQLSGGQRQRVAIIQQMMCSKHFLLMDEPFSGLDIVAKESACNLITQMAEGDDLNTIIITTHDIHMACAVADRVIMLGRDRDVAGQIIPGARIIGDYNLADLDLCWIPGITRTQKFFDFVAAVEEQFHTL